MNFKNILVPFDGSKFSKRVVTTAVSIAQKYHGKLSILTCIGEFYTGRWYLDNRIAEEEFKKEYAKAKNELKKIKQQATNRGVSATVKIFRTDDVVKQIARYTKQNRFNRDWFPWAYRTKQTTFGKQCRGYYSQREMSSYDNKIKMSKINEF